MHVDVHPHAYQQFLRYSPIYFAFYHAEGVMSKATRFTLVRIAFSQKCVVGAAYAAPTTHFRYDFENWKPDFNFSNQASGGQGERPFQEHP